MSHALHFRLISPKIAASLLDLPSVMFITSLSTSVTVSFILSTKYSLFTGLFKMYFVLGTLALAPRIWPPFPWSSFSKIPVLHIVLDCLSPSTITTSFNSICGRLDFCNFTLWFSLRLIRYYFFQRSPKWFRILLIFLEWTFKSAGVYDISNGSRLKIFSCLPNNKWFRIKRSSASSS